MKDVFELAKEAGFMQHLGVICAPNHLALERFAALVIANHPPQSYMTWQEGHEAGKQAGREHIAAWMIQRGYSTGHGDTTKDLLDELDWQVVQNWTSAMKTGVETEREACAKVLDEMAEDMEREMEPSTAIAYVRSKAAAIRARGETK